MYINRKRKFQPPGTSRTAKKKSAIIRRFFCLSPFLPFLSFCLSPFPGITISYQADGWRFCGNGYSTASADSVKTAIMNYGAAACMVYVDSYFVAYTAVVEREFGNREQITDHYYEKMVISLDDVNLGNRGGIRHINAWEFIA